MTPLWSEFEPFVTVIRKENPYQYPVLVHCSAGVGRTGSFIAVDRLMQQKTYKNEFDIRGILDSLRAKTRFFLGSLHSGLSKKIKAHQTPLPRQTHSDFTVLRGAIIGIKTPSLLCWAQNYKKKTLKTIYFLINQFKLIWFKRNDPIFKKKKLWAILQKKKQKSVGRSTPTWQ